MVKFLDLAGLSALWNKIKSALNLKQDKLKVTIGSMYRTNVGGSGSLSISGTTGLFPNISTAGTYTVITLAESATSNYTINITFGSNSYTLTSNNGIIDDSRLLTLATNDRWNGSISTVATNTKVGVYIVDDYIEGINIVGVTGNYSDLSNKPSIPAAQIQADWNQTTTTAKDYIKNKPTIPDVSGKEDTSNKVTSISSSSTNTQYPSALAVYTAISNASIGGSDAGECPDLSLGTTVGSGNAVTNISVSGHEITLTKGTTFATLDSNGLVPANQLPSYVDDVIDGYKYGDNFYRPVVNGELKENATSADFTNDTLVTPVKNKIYFWVDDGHCYRWSGTAYVLIIASPGTTDSITEGSTNLYFTDARALSALSSALSGKKNTQTAVSDPSASGTSVTFIATLSQNTQGVITPTKKTVKTMAASGSGHSGGLVPDTPSTTGTTKFLREDATWSVPDFASTTHSHGYINNIGLFDVAMGTNDFASGDRLLFVGDLNEILCSNITFDGSTTTLALSKAGSWLTFLTSHQDITGKADKAVPTAANNVALLDVNGNLVDSGKTLGKSVPSNAVFTDVACNEQYHYTPSTADNSSNIDLVPGGVLKIITAINLDSRKHVVSVTSGDLTKSMVGLSAVTNDKQVKGLASGTTSGHIVTFGADGYTIADSGVSTSDFATSTHVHGNITNAGALQTTDITIANGDKLVVTDSSNSNKVARASATFDGSTTSSVLTKKGTFESLKTINGNSIIGTGDITITGGNGSDAGEDLGPLFITSYITDSSVNSGTYALIALAITDGRDVILKVINDNADDEIRYYRLLIDYSETDYLYNFGCVIGTYFYLGTISSSNSLSFTSASLGGGSGSGLPSVTSSDNGKILLVVNGSWTLVTPSTLYSGSGTPSNSLGNNGDIYILTS